MVVSSSWLLFVAVTSDLHSGEQKLGATGRGGAHCGAGPSPMLCATLCLGCQVQLPGTVKCVFTLQGTPLSGHGRAATDGGWEGLLTPPVSVAGDGPWYPRRSLAMCVPGKGWARPCLGCGLASSHGYVPPLVPPWLVWLSGGWPNSKY